MAELYELESDRDDAENEISDRSSIHDSYCEQIQRLRQAKGLLNDIMDQASNVSDDLKEGYEEFSGYWSGDSFNNLKMTVDKEVGQDTYDYHKALKEVISEIDDKISELENARDDNENIVCDLRDRLSDLWYDINHWDE